MSTSRKDANLRSYNCAHCRKEVTISKAVASHGIAFLFGKEDGYYGLICPSCGKTSILGAAMDELKSLKHRLFEVTGDLEASNHPRLQYNSFPYRIDHVMRASRVLKRPFIKPLTGIHGSLSHDEIRHFFDNQKMISKGYFSYGMGDSAMGPAIAVWWVGKENIEQLLRAENNTGMKVFPRYVLYDPLIATIQNFCWKYQISGNPISDLELSAYPELQSREPQATGFNVDIAKNNEFLSILRYPNAQPAEDLEKTKGAGDGIHSETKESSPEIDIGFDDQRLQRRIGLLSARFMKQFLVLASRSDFTRGDVNKLKAEHIRELSSSEEGSASFCCPPLAGVPFQANTGTNRYPTQE